MNTGKATAKRGRPKRKTSENQSSDQAFAGKKLTKKAKKSQSASLKKIDSQSKVKKRVVDSMIDQSSDSDDEISISGENGQKLSRVRFEKFNSDKVFAQILNKANKQAQFLIMLKNLLSGGFRSIEDKKNLIQRKWKLLRNSNCTQDEYFSRQAELRKMQNEQIKQMEEDIMQKLSSAGIKGFESKQNLIETYRKNNPDVKEFWIDQDSWEKYHAQQKKLLNLLRKQNDFVSHDYRRTVSWSKSHSEQVQKPKEPSLQDNQMQKKFNTLDVGENPQSAQFYFCKNYKDLNYDKIFDNGFRIQESQKYYVDSKAMSWLLQSKSDQIYTNEKFQKETYEKYIAQLKVLYEKPEYFSDKEVMDRILELTAYLLNSVHYYQKFKLKCDILHPLDLLLVIEKLSKERRAVGQP